MKAKSDYKYKIIHGKILFVDLNLGNMSVTNDIENVIEDICHKENMLADIQPVTYRDSSGAWDRYDFMTYRFMPLVPSSFDIEFLNNDFDNGTGWKDKVTD